MITRTALVASYHSCLAARTEATEWAWDTGEGKLGVTWGQRYVSVLFMGAHSLVVFGIMCCNAPPLGWRSENK